MKELPDYQLMHRNEAGLRELINRASSIVDIDDSVRALVMSGLRVQSLLDKVSDDLEVAADLTIDSAELLEEAEQIAGRLAAVFSDSSGEIEKERQAMVGPLNGLVKMINAGYKAPREYGGTVLDGLKTKILAYHQAERAKREAEEAAERAKREEAARAAAAAEAAAKKEAEALVQAAQEAQASGSEIAAQALVSEAANKVDQARADATAAVQALHTAPSVAAAPKAKGVRGRWSAEVIDKQSLILFVADRIKAGDFSLVSLLEVDTSAADKKAALEQTGFNVPGLRARFAESVSVRRVATV